MKNLDMWALAWKNAVRGKWRTFLCALSIGVGVLAVYLIGQVSFGMKNQVENEIEKTGMRGVMVYASGESAKLTAEQIRSLSTDIPNVSAAIPIYSKYGSVHLRNEKEKAMIWGIDEQFPRVFGIELLHGRLPTKADVAAGLPVAVIEDSLAKKIYRRTNIVGKRLQLQVDGFKQNFEIIGVIVSQKEGITSMIGGDQIPTFVYVPHPSMELLGCGNTTEQLAFSCDESADKEAVSAMVIHKLQYLAQNSTFSSENIDGYIRKFKSLLNLITMGITAIGLITLFVGGIGVMNSMTSAVDRRKKEIGIYMAIGAGKREILCCYLYESILICAMGGAAGGALGVAILKAIEAMIGFHLGGGMVFLLITEALTVLCGILFGFLPARRAAVMSPIDAIRSE